MWKGGFWKTSGEKWLNDWQLPEKHKKRGFYEKMTVLP